MNRNTTNTVTFGTNTHSTEATVNTAIPISSGRRRPSASLIGPMINCPSDRPSIIEVNVNCTCASTAPRSSVICGNAGRYMSVANGPVAVSRPSTNTRSTTDRRDLGRTAEDSDPSCSSATESGEFGDRTDTPVHGGDEKAGTHPLRAHPPTGDHSIPTPAHRNGCPIPHGKNVNSVTRSKRTIEPRSAASTRPWRRCITLAATNLDPQASAHQPLQQPIHLGLRVLGQPAVDRPRLHDRAPRSRQPTKPLPGPLTPGRTRPETTTAHHRHRLQGTAHTLHVHPGGQGRQTCLVQIPPGRQKPLLLRIDDDARVDTLPPLQAGNHTQQGVLEHHPVAVLTHPAGRHRVGVTLHLTHCVTSGNQRRSETRASKCRT